MIDITPLTPIRVKSYNKLLKKILNKPAMELFFEVGIGLIEVEPDEHLINEIVQELADREDLNINDLNLYLRQINEFYNASIASYGLVNTENPVVEDLSNLEKIVATFMQLETEEKNREIMISICDKAIETIAHEYDFWEELHFMVTHDELVEHIDSIFGEMIALNTGFFSFMDISRMLKKGATEDEFYEFSMLMTIVLAAYNEVRQYRYEFMQEEEYPPLEVLVKPYMKTKVATLFSLGIEAIEEDGFSYNALGLSRKNKKQLLELGSDLALYYYDFDEEDECLEFFAVIHAWRALSELKIPEAKTLFVELLRQLFEEEDDLDWMARLFKKLILPFREDMFDESVSYILDENEHEWFRAEFINLLQSMLHNNEIEKNSLSKVFEKLFKRCENPIVNATAIAVCKDERLTEHYLQIKKLYEKKWVDKALDGDLEDVELAFEMRSERSTERDLGFHDLLEKSFGAENLLPEQRKAEEKIGRNDPCPCGSSKKYKKCCMNK